MENDLREHLRHCGRDAKWLIAAAAVYLILTKTASWKIIVSTLVSAFAMSGILFLFGLSSINRSTQ
jgi:Na+-transporting NADH:ubiquinone oxidoreductase subunit B